MPRKTRQHIQNRIFRDVLKVKSQQYDVCKSCGNLSKTIKNRLFYCCKNTICYYCEKEYNFQHTINDCIEQEKKTKIVNDLLSTALIHRCHKCKLPFLKIDDSTEACNIIKCKCGVKQCYACRQPAGHNHQCSSFDSKAFDIHNRDLKKAEANLKC
uniref:RING-type domain-containing protein n=1 Tax=Panagrolaimus davidi TaxID=227884 RepID=A0A914PUQ0_9BILA